VAFDWKAKGLKAIFRAYVCVESWHGLAYLTAKRRAALVTFDPGVVASPSCPASQL
jgi:hypothetical protein